MIIGIDARAAVEVPAGRGRVVRELLESLAALDNDHEFIVYCRQPAEQLELDERFEWRQIGHRDPLWHLAAARDANRSCDVFLSTNSYLTVWFLRIPSVMVVYDLVAFIKGAIPQRRAQAIERTTLGFATYRVSRAISISDATERDLLERYPHLRERSDVVPLAPSVRFDQRPSHQDVADMRTRLGVEVPFVLSVGVLDPRKNLQRMIDAYAGLPAQLREQRKLVLVGPKGPELEQVLAATELHSSDVELLGYVSDQDLLSLYAACELFCYPSLYEGFGLPVVEAMACGAPVITSNVSSLPEVGGDAVEYVDDPESVDDIRSTMGRLLESPQRREELSRLGPAQAAKFSWEKTARGFLTSLELTVKPDQIASANMPNMSSNGPGRNVQPPTDKDLIHYSVRLGAGGVRHLAGREALWRMWMPIDVDRVVELPWTAQSIMTYGPGRVLDIASPKLLSCWLADKAGMHVTATDVWREDVESWRRLVDANRGRAPGLDRMTLESADATNLSYDDASFDSAFSTSVIEHIPGDGDVAAMAELERVLKPGGVLALTFPLRQRLEDEFVDHDLYGQRYTGEPIFFQRHYSPRAVDDRLLAGRSFDVVEQVVWRKEGVEASKRQARRLIPAKWELGRFLGPVLPRIGRRVMQPSSVDSLGPDNVMGLLLRKR